MEVSSLCSLCNSVNPQMISEKKGLKGYTKVCEVLEKLEEHEALDRVKKAWEKSELHVHKHCLLSLFNKSKAATRSDAKTGYDGLLSS